MGDTPFLEVKNLRKSFGNHEVLKDISLSVKQGEDHVIGLSRRIGNLHITYHCNHCRSDRIQRREDQGCDVPRRHLHTRPWCL